MTSSKFHKCDKVEIQLFRSNIPFLGLTSLNIRMPRLHFIAQVSKIAEAAGATLAGQEYTIDCSKIGSLPAVELTLGGGKKFTLEAKDYVQVQGEGPCLFTIMPFEMSPKLGEMWILGDVFMRKYYTVFDYGNKRVGMAPVKAAAATEQASILV